MITARDLGDAMGSALLVVVVPGRPHPVTDIGFAEPAESAAQPGDLVLAVGLSSPAAVADLVERVHACGAAGLVVRATLLTDPATVATARRLGLTLLALESSVSWSHIVWLLRGAVDRATGPASPAPGGASVHDDLFALADACAAIVDAPVTIEDPQSRVLAYSSRQERTDPARVSTIVGRRVPQHVVSHFRSVGVFRKLTRSDEPIYVPAGPEGVLPRLIVPVRAGGEWLGSVWAVVERPVPAARVHELRSAAGVLALHLLRLRAQADLAHRLSGERLRAALRQVTPDAQDPLDPASAPWRVVALAGPRSSSSLHERTALWEAVARRHGWRDPRIVDLDDVLFAVVVDGGPETTAGSWAWFGRMVRHELAGDPSLRAAAGRPADGPGELPRSRAEAAELLALPDHAVPDPVVSFEQSWAAVTVHRATRPLAASGWTGPLEVLRAHDRERGTSFVATLAATLAHPGEPQRSAAELRVHVNSVRYRLRRLHELVDLDLTDPQVRLALQLQIAAVPR